MTPERKVMAFLSAALLVFTGKWIANEWKHSQPGKRGAIIGIGSALLIVAVLAAARAFGFF
jgi:hypothetical protein